MYLFLFLSVLPLMQAAPVEWKMNFTGHKVVRVFPVENRDFHKLTQLTRDASFDIDPWSEAAYTNSSMDLHVPKHSYQHFVKHMNRFGIQFEVLIEDIQSLIDHTDDAGNESADDITNTTLHHHHRRSTSRREGYIYHTPDRSSADDSNNIVGKYATYPEIVTWMNTQWQEHNDIVDLHEIGSTYEGRPIKLMQIGRPSEGLIKPAIWIDAGIHAREWIAPATAIYIANQLLSGYGTDPGVTALVNQFDWYILPVANPDGYQYSHEVDRLWRKTRSRQDNFWFYRYRCQGVDPNRNFNYKFRAHCSGHYCRSQNPCDATYSGEAAFSEVETRSMANFILRRQGPLKMYLSLHSYSQMWLTPWGFTSQPPSDFNDMMRVANKASAEMQNDYIVGSPASILYPAGGGSYDWAKAVANIKYSYTVELPDKGYYGFLLPSNRILPVGEETFKALKAAVIEMKKDVCWVYGVRCSSG